jgi:hypothetical protein
LICHTPFPALDFSTSQLFSLRLNLPCRWVLFGFISPTAGFGLALSVSQLVSVWLYQSHVWFSLALSVSQLVSISLYQSHIWFSLALSVSAGFSLALSLSQLVSVWLYLPHNLCQFEYSLLGRTAASIRLNTTFRGLAPSPSGKTEISFA